MRALIYHGKPSGSPMGPQREARLGGDGRGGHYRHVAGSLIVSNEVRRRHMPKRKPKLAVFADRIAEARRIIDAQQALLEKLRIGGQPTFEAEVALRTYASSLAFSL